MFIKSSSYCLILDIIFINLQNKKNDLTFHIGKYVAICNRDLDHTEKALNYDECVLNEFLEEVRKEVKIGGREHRD